MLGVPDLSRSNGPRIFQTPVLQRTTDFFYYFFFPHENSSEGSGIG